MGFAWQITDPDIINAIKYVIFKSKPSYMKDYIFFTLRSSSYATKDGSNYIYEYFNDYLKDVITIKIPIVKINSIVRRNKLNKIS